MLIKQIIGTVTIALVGFVFVAGDIATRLLIVPWVFLRPGSRYRVLGPWAQWTARNILAVVRTVGGARFQLETRVPCRGGELIVANHQALLDVPILTNCVPEGYPRFVTHIRYASGVPLVSFFIRFYRHIGVRPGGTGAAELAALAETARTSEHPIVIFPEGHRTRDGEIRPWKRAGLETFLGAREWRVHVVVIDGLWETARIPDFIRNVTRTRCRVVTAAVLQYDGRGRESHAEFIDEMHRIMCDKLAAMRAESSIESARRARPAGVL